LGQIPTAGDCLRFPKRDRFHQVFRVTLVIHRPVIACWPPIESEFDAEVYAVRADLGKELSGSKAGEWERTSPPPPEIKPRTIDGLPAREVTAKALARGLISRPFHYQQEKNI